MTAPKIPTGQDLIVKFERIGRTGSTPEAALTVHVPANLATDPDRIAEVLSRHVDRHLRSSYFTLSVDLATGEVLIEGGRFGRGQILVAQPAGEERAT